jgi:hypothetical protein
MINHSRFVAIVGAPRCGTTSLAGFLQDHPGVCFSFVKEPHFFAQHDLRGIPQRELSRFVESEYLGRFFPDRGQGSGFLAEGSVSYLYAPEQMEPVVQLWPEARFIIALRDPMEMMPSLHRRLLFNGDETIADFERAWGLTEQRRQGSNIPRSCIDARALQYEMLGRLGTHVDRFFRAVGRERCFVSLFDDLRADPEALYRRLMAFLELPVQDLPDFTPRRPSRGFKSGRLQRLLKRPPIGRTVFGGEKLRLRMKQVPNDRPDTRLLKTIFAARKQLLGWNSAPLPPVRLSESLRRDIRLRLKDDVAELGELIGRDLGHWLDGPARPAISAEQPLATILAA